jgi:6-phosphogluconolactonase
MTPRTLWVGTYAEAGGRGLVRLEYDPDTGFTAGQAVEDAANASFGAWSKRNGVHYLVDEQGAGAVGAWRRAGGEWQKIGAVPSGGREPCYVTLDPAEQRIAVANYGSGSVALFEPGGDGAPRDGGTLWANNGHGPNAERQEGPHMHCVCFSPDSRWLYAVDLGTDQILRFALDAPTLLREPQCVYHAPPGSGPRHLLFHPTLPIALLVSELANTLTLFDVRPDGLSSRSRCSTLPAGFTGDSLGGHLALNAAGTHGYVTNRGHDSVAVFRIDGAEPGIELLQHVASGGASPRFILLMEDVARLIAINEECGSVVAMALRSDGTLEPTGHSVSVAGAAYVFRQEPFL